MKSPRPECIYSRGRKYPEIRLWLLAILILGLFSMVARNLILRREIQKLKEDLAVYQTGAMKSLGDRINQIRAIEGGVNP